MKDTPITIVALLVTLGLRLGFTGEVILRQPLTSLRIAVSLFLPALLVFWPAYGWARLPTLPFGAAAQEALLGRPNQVTIATASMRLGLASGAALATVVGALIVVPVLPWLVRICRRPPGWFGPLPPTRHHRTSMRKGN